MFGFFFFYNLNNFIINNYASDYLNLRKSIFQREYLVFFSIFLKIDKFTGIVCVDKKKVEK